MKSPAFSFYVRDWLCSKTVSKLHSKAYSKEGSNLCSRGLNAYLFLLCAAWLEDGKPTLPDDDEELCALARVTPEEWEVIKPMVMSKFQHDTTGRFFNDRLNEEWEKQQKRKLNGSKGGSQKVANSVAALEIANEDANGTEIPTIEEAVAMTMTAGIPESFSRYVYQDWSSRGGRDGAGNIVRWLPYVVKRWAREQVEWRNGNHKGNKSAKRKGPNI